MAKIAPRAGGKVRDDYRSTVHCELLSNGVRFFIFEGQEDGAPDNERDCVLNWSGRWDLLELPSEPNDFRGALAFWLKPAGVWVAFVLTSEWTFRGINETVYGPCGCGLPTPTVGELSQSEGALVCVQVAGLEQLRAIHSIPRRAVFISYGGPDVEFATRLNDRLRWAGVSTFFFPDDAPPGAKLHHVMRDGVNRTDRVLLVCSRSALDRPGVSNELDETLQREAREGGRPILVPITIDDYVFSDWDPDRPGLAQAVRDRVVGDFRRALEDPVTFSRSVDRVVKALKDDAVAPAPSPRFRSQAETIEALVRQLSLSKPSYRTFAAKELKQIGKDAAALACRPLITCLRDDSLSEEFESRETRVACLEALSTVGRGNREVVAELLHVFEHEGDLLVREAAASALGQMETTDPVVIDTLVEYMTRHASQTVRVLAATALARLTVETGCEFPKFREALASDGRSQMPIREWFDLRVKEQGIDFKW